MIWYWGFFFFFAMKVIKHQNRHEFQSLEILKTQLEICPEHTALIRFHPERGLGTDTSRSPSSLNYFVFPGLSPASWGTKLSQTLPGKVWPIVTSLFCVRDRGMFLFKYCLWVCGSYPLVTGFILETSVWPWLTSRKTNLLLT